MISKYIILVILWWLFFEPTEAMASTVAVQANPAQSLDSLSNSLVIVGACSIVCAIIWSGAIVQSAKLKYQKGEKSCHSKSSNISRLH